MYRLYEFASSGNCYKLRLAMAQLGVPFERVEKDITRCETRSDWVNRKNMRMPCKRNSKRGMRRWQ